MIRTVILMIAFLLAREVSTGQEKLMGLYHNPKILHELKANMISGPERSFETGYPSPIKLPVFTDFHTDHIFPDTALFTDRDAYINNDFAYRSVNIGVATLDAIDENGRLYANASTFPFIADHLTSRPIRLDSLFLPGETRAVTVADSVYFSFYYQPQGRGNQPEPFDSLVLQFGYFAGDSIFAYIDSVTVSASNYLSGPGDTIFPLDTIFAPSQCNQGIYLINYDTIVWGDVITLPCDSVFIPDIKWEHIWSTEGMSLESFYNTYNTYCRQVLIPVSDSARYYRKNFFFRFYNYASLSSEFNPSWRANCDQWNIDYIYLNTNRSAADSLYRTITFAERAPSFLKDFTSMPLRQYRNDPTNQLKDSLQLFITNLSADTFNVYYEYLVDEAGGPFTTTYNGGFANLYPFISAGYQSCANVPQHACPPRTFLFPLSSQADSSSYRIRHVIRDQSNPDLGDTISFIQKFYNYYAYDDGTPELGYGLSLSGGQVGSRFTLNIADSLKGIAMFFNRVQNNQNDQFFTLKVWDNNNGRPGNVIWEKENLKPKFSDELYRMHIYEIDPPVPVIGTFFIGWEQTTPDNLNVGFDTYNDASANLFYNVSGEWEPSAYQGSLLMRPVLYQYYDPFIVNDNIMMNEAWRVYPNPLVNGIMYIDNSVWDINSREYEGLTITIHDMLGRMVHRQAFSSETMLGHLQKGMYLVHIHSNDGSIHAVRKILINQ